MRLLKRLGWILLLGVLVMSMTAKASEEPDVIVIGSGIAGLTAALSAKEQGSSVIVLEKMSTIGGNSLLSTGLMNAPDPERQKPLGIEDSEELFYKQTMYAGRNKNKPELVRALVKGALPSLKWLSNYGIDFKKDILQIYGGVWPRGHYPVVSHGRGYINFLTKACNERGIPIKTDSRVTELLTKTEGDQIKVIGVKVLSHGKTADYFAKKAVVIATGGFTANQKMCEALDPRLKGMGHTGSANATGEMLEVAQKAGASLKDLDQIQCNLGPEEQFKLRSGYHTDVRRHILVNREGKRFINEDGLRDDLRDAVLAQPGKVIYSMVDSKGYQKLSSTFQQNGAMGERDGNAFKARTIEELARKMGVPPENLVATVNDYNRAVETKSDPLGREEWMLTSKIDKPPFYASRVRMSIHYTMGGIEIDKNARVLDTHGRPIVGLYAAGEVTTGVHGSNRVGGNGVLDAVVFGRIAGQMASGATEPVLR